MQFRFYSELQHVVSSFLHYTCYSVFKIPTVLKSKLFKLWSLQANSRVLLFSKQISEESFLSPQICFEEWAQVDSNHRPHAYQACALTGWAMGPFLGGDEGNRTPDPLLAKQVLSQLSYTPIFLQGLLVGFSRYFAVPSKLNNAITSFRCVSFESFSWIWTGVLSQSSCNFARFSLERRWSSRTFRYGYLVTT